ncbi:unnamed protein product [Strongylus vulgaris]|uniref:Peptidase A1 domain-containing protein n=1 Tax=Strongylus vulgaris TaxID=40348 RepID=A0A3P7M0E1_STRVU|nr:unnamed protein product [Strongylus vulgaris]
MDYLLLILSAIASLAVAKIYQMPLMRIESSMAQMIRNGTWAKHVRERNNLRRIYVWNDIRSTTAQNVAIDTGTADTWVVDYACGGAKPLICDESICDQGRESMGPRVGFITLQQALF